MSFTKNQPWLPHAEAPGGKEYNFISVEHIIPCMTIKRMSHAVYHKKYHLVWPPKYRKWILNEKVQDAAREMFKKILAARLYEAE
jgi:hypothetical protein